MLLAAQCAVGFQWAISTTEGLTSLAATFRFSGYPVSVSTFLLPFKLNILGESLSSGLFEVR